MSTARGAKLKAQYNRVRTSDALKTTGIWANTIGISEEQGANAAVEASIYAPGGGGGRGRAARREQAQQLIQASGYTPSVTDFEGLKALARAQGGAVNTNRGACRICGGLGHLTKQCRNLPPGGAGGGAGGPSDGLGANLALLTAEDEGGLTSLDTSELDTSGSDSGSDRERSKKRKQKESSSSKHKESSSKKHKKDKEKEKKKKKEKEKHKKKKRRHDD